MRERFKTVLEINNIFGQKMEFFELTKLEDGPVDLEFFAHMLKEHDLVLNFCGWRVGQLLNDSGAFYAAMDATKALTQKSVRCRIKSTKIKYVSKEQALYCQYNVQYDVEQPPLIVPQYNVQHGVEHRNVYLKISEKTSTDLIKREDELNFSRAKASDLKIKDDDIDLSGIMLFGTVVKTIVRIDR